MDTAATDINVLAVNEHVAIKVKTNRTEFDSIQDDQILRNEKTIKLGHKI